MDLDPSLDAPHEISHRQRCWVEICSSLRTLLLNTANATMQSPGGITPESFSHVVNGAAVLFLLEQQAGMADALEASAERKLQAEPWEK